jgi:hypothetical protein
MCRPSERIIRDCHCHGGDIACHATTIITKGIDVPAAVKEDWILADPPSRLRVVPATAELDEASVGIVKPALEPERLEAGIGVAEDAPEGVVVEPLRGFATGKDPFLAHDNAAESVAL